MDEDDSYDEPEDELDLLEREREVAEADVFKGLENLVASWSKPPKTLAHYTSIQNAVSIVDVGDIWLFNAYTMNDEQEIDHALDFIERRVSSSDLSSLVEDRLSFPRRGRRSVYVFCLSPADDLDRLSMWRAYGDDGNGVAIKMRTAALAMSVNPKLSGMVPALSEVVYRDDMKAERIDALLAAFRRLCSTHPNFTEEDLVGALTSMLWKVAPTFKHVAFAEEREWRLIVEVDKPIFPATMERSSLIEFLDNRRPYIRLKLGKSPGEGILSFLAPATFEGALVGPSKNARANAATIGAALLKQYWDPDVQVSLIPYRGRA